MWFSQLGEYRVLARARSVATAPIPVVSRTVEKWESLDDQYGLVNMFEDPAELMHEMSLDEEYASYVNAPLSPKGTPLIKYWEVMCLLYLVWSSYAYCNSFS
jgi:hypothetical protein